MACIDAFCLLYNMRSQLIQSAPILGGAAEIKYTIMIARPLLTRGRAWPELESVSVSRYACENTIMRSMLRQWQQY